VCVCAYSLLLQDADIDKSGELDFTEFVKLRERLLHRTEFEELFKLYSDGNEVKSDHGTTEPMMSIQVCVGVSMCVRVCLCVRVCA